MYQRIKKDSVLSIRIPTAYIGAIQTLAESRHQCVSEAVRDILRSALSQSRYLRN